MSGNCSWKTKRAVVCWHCKAQPAAGHVLSSNQLHQLALNFWSRQNLLLDIWTTECICLILLQKSCKLIYGQKVKASPYVRFSSIAFSADHLWAHPIWRASDRADACSRHTDCLQPFASPKVPKLHIPSRVTENIGSWTKNKEWRQLFSCSPAVGSAAYRADIQPRNTHVHGMAFSPLSLRWPAKHHFFNSGCRQANC